MVGSVDTRRLQRELRKGIESIGRDLDDSLRRIVEALEDSGGGEPSRQLPERLREIREREDGSRELCLRILANRNGNTAEIRWTECAHTNLSLMEKTLEEISAMLGRIDEIQRQPSLPLAKDLPVMGRMANRMLRGSIRNLLHPDEGKTHRIIESEISLDQRKEAFVEKAVAFVRDHPDKVGSVIPYVLVSRHLEKIGDHASHMAEEVGYYLRGRLR